jgi:hypothetical protein
VEKSQEKDRPSKVKVNGLRWLQSQESKPRRR